MSRTCLTIASLVALALASESDDARKKYEKYMSGQGGDYQKYMKKDQGGDYQKYMKKDQGGDYKKYMKGQGGDYSKYMKGQGQDLGKVDKNSLAASVCDTIDCLNAWRAKQETEIKNFVPSVYQTTPMDKISSTFETNRARIQGPATTVVQGPATPVALDINPTSVSDLTIPKSAMPLSSSEVAVGSADALAKSPVPVELSAVATFSVPSDLSTAAKPSVPTTLSAVALVTESSVVESSEASSPVLQFADSSESIATAVDSGGASPVVYGLAGSVPAFGLGMLVMTALQRRRQHEENAVPEAYENHRELLVA